MYPARMELLHRRQRQAHGRCGPRNHRRRIAPCPSGYRAAGVLAAISGQSSGIVPDFPRARNRSVSPAYAAPLGDHGGVHGGCPIVARSKSRMRPPRPYAARASCIVAAIASATGAPSRGVSQGTEVGYPEADDATRRRHGDVHCPRTLRQAARELPGALKSTSGNTE